jgi:hypothetical protein
LQFFDQDGSGFITREEMVQQFQELGGLLDKAEIELFHDILDSDGNGVIDVRSRPHMHLAMRKGLCTSRSMMMFERVPVTEFPPGSAQHAAVGPVLLRLDLAGTCHTAHLRPMTSLMLCLQYTEFIQALQSTVPVMDDEDSSGAVEAISVPHNAESVG